MIFSRFIRYINLISLNIRIKTLMKTSNKKRIIAKIYKLLDEKAKELRNDIEVSEKYLISYRVAEKIGLKVKEDVIPSAGGLIKKDNCYFIVVNSYHPVPRKNFTCAHEIGHYIMIKDENIKNLLRSLGDNLTDMIERFADYFASCLLITESDASEIINELEKDFSHETLEILAKKYTISLEAFIYRFTFEKKFLLENDRFIVLFKKIFNPSNLWKKRKWRIVGRIMSKNFYVPLNISAYRIGINKTILNDDLNDVNRRYHAKLRLKDIMIKKNGKKWKNISNLRNLLFKVNLKFYRSSYTHEKYVIGFFELLGKYKSFLY